MKPNIGMTESQRRAVCGVLSSLLADEYVLYTKTRNYHWNVEGPQFDQLHKFFQVQYEMIDVIVDDVAERIRALGQKSPGTLAEFAKETQLKEHPASHPAAKDMLSLLTLDHEAIIRSLRSGIAAVEKQNDAGTADFLTGLLEQHEKAAWMLRSFAGE
jgi:starvation-inducible DNA-binding protein